MFLSGNLTYQVIMANDDLSLIGRQEFSFGHPNQIGPMSRDCSEFHFKIKGLLEKISCPSILNLEGCNSRRIMINLSIISLISMFYTLSLPYMF